MIAATFQAVRSWAENHSPVFIVGPPRTGTSVLYMALARTPALFSVGGVFETAAFRINLLTDKLRPMAVKYAGGRDSFFRFRQWCAMLRMPLGSNKAEVAQAYFHYCSEEVYNRDRVLEKSPSHIKNIWSIKSAFPHSKIIICTRDPLFIIASYRKRLAIVRRDGLPEAKNKWLDKPIQGHLNNLFGLARIIRQARTDFSQDVYICSYELLTRRSEETLEALLGFIGEGGTVNPRKLLGGEDMRVRPTSGIVANDYDLASYITPDEQDFVIRNAMTIYESFQTPRDLALPSP